MTAEEFNDVLETLSWKGSDFARKVGMVENTVWRWRNGRTPIPRWVGEYLSAILAIQRLHVEFVAPPLKGGQALESLNRTAVSNSESNSADASDAMTTPREFGAAAGMGVRGAP